MGGVAPMPMLSDTINGNGGQVDILRGLDRHSKDRRDLFVLVLELERGNVSNACKVIGIQRGTYNQWCLDHNSFREECKDIQYALLDMAEGKLLDNVEGGQQRAIEFYLECQAKDRGYVKRREVTGDGGGPIKVIGELPAEQLRLLEAAARQGAREEVALLHSGDIQEGELIEMGDTGGS